ncbi:MAG: 2-oxo-4-hydroxy-4-carboxy-5-ureidoimidazoline decarboxylase [Candidatus Melainabacteria bacterium]|nr:2-oxo-4-hydroxy-4-carboxy-5-ureidoimidazoline decarboxylase [Candidatus Melainabacteria bacterium]
MQLSLLNELEFNDARDAFLKCCGSERWAYALAAARPYESDDELLKMADAAFAEFGRDDWMDAFAAHPKIGDVDSLRQKYGNTKDWAQSEQAGVNGVSDDVIERLASGNKLYEDRFGYIFIVCATGKSAEEMLAILNGRVDNDPEIELGIAAEEQKKITHIRLGKL